ncbi:two-component system activity regulator YycH [Rossellomorea sp. SC111]|uniref:YycH family regulatory protein n=1 Tax=Rossellomorea sp. SC111 TaxID=2968985 RepID=UPI00215B25E7|nr:two-component system activity regulator YycH [Rossellomorea sp. SC111]MCR8849880.1 two-component system activity regulator YycH [Rossellomorea sp. SC111]
MNYEKIKSIVLTLLVCISVFLTFNLWTYSPGYDTINSDAYDVSVGGKLKDNELNTHLIKPYKLFYHGRDKTVGTTNQTEMNKVTEQLGKWSLFEIKNVSNEYSVQEINTLIQGQDKFELIFPDIVPLSVFSQGLSLEEKNVSSASFNRIVIDLENNNNRDTGSIFFITVSDDKEKKTVYESQVSLASMDSFKRTFVQRALYNSAYRQYVEQPISGKKTIFLPKDAEEYISYYYYTELSSLDEYKQALFSDPNSVNMGSVDDLVTYMDVSSILTVDKNHNTFSFVNPSEEKDNGSAPAMLVQKSMEFVNDHGGWTDDYQLFSISPYENKIVYRLFLQNHPVFNDNGMAEISQTWGLNGINKYSRPYFKLDFSFKDTAEVLLPSGSSVIYALNQVDSIDLNYVEDIAVGYKMTRDPNESRKLNFEPSWYYKYDGNWLRLSVDDKEGL